MADAKDNISPLRKPVPCPNCGQTSHRESYPFCSKRCADVDLNRWFSGSYAIAANEANDEEDDWSDGDQ
jgi:endogenous inhibitor of DNA gyrase (YacG/DUF329 family)